MGGIRSLLATLLIPVVPLLLRPQAREAEARVRLLDRPLLPVGKLGNHVPLTKALSYVGLYIRGDYTLFGIEVLLKEDKEPVVEVNVPQDSTVRTVLDQIVRQLPDYRYEVAGEHLINVFPLAAKQDPNGLLNIRLPSFDVVGQPADTLITHPEIFVSELDARLRALRSAPPGTHPLGPGLTGGEPKITLHLRNVTVREILNAVSVATERAADSHSPIGWVYSFQPDKSLHNWTPYLSLPDDWRQPEKNSPK